MLSDDDPPCHCPSNKNPLPGHLLRSTDVRTRRGNARATVLNMKSGQLLWSWKLSLNSLAITEPDRKNAHHYSKQLKQYSNQGISHRGSSKRAAAAAARSCTITLKSFCGIF
jgi:hypothetical protein